MNPSTSAFMRSLNNPYKFRMFLLLKLPNAFFAGIRMKGINENRCSVTVPYKWFTKNPFRSTYFACLGMAAEMSTGALCMLHLYKIIPAVSMLVVKVESEYFKKATGRTKFTCEDGVLIKETIEDAIQSGESKKVRALSTGRNHDGAVIAEFYITWSFKVKKNQ